MFFNGGIIITFNSFPSECRNSQVFTHFYLKMTLSFAILGSIAVTTLKFIPHLDKCSYITAIEEILNDNSKFSKLDIPAGKEINHIVNLEKRITSELHLQQLMNLLSLIHFILLKKLVNRIPTYTWLVWTLILYLLIFP